MSYTRQCIPLVDLGGICLKCYREGRTLEECRVDADMTQLLTVNTVSA
jgi:hypothetical protein